jgi:predicted AAA+ superfamily ATPase
LLLKNGAPDVLLQVSLDVHSANTHSRELKALSYAGEELGVKLLYLVTIDPVEKTIDHDGKVIKILPAWRVLEIL